MNCLEYTNYYFIGIGGIGMSSLAEYILHLNKNVEGYDREKSSQSRRLNKLSLFIKMISIDNLYFLEWNHFYAYIFRMTLAVQDN